MTKTIQVSGIVYAANAIAHPTRYAQVVFKDRLGEVDWTVSGKELRFELRRPLVFDDDTTVGALKRKVMATADWNVQWTFETNS